MSIRSRVERLLAASPDRCRNEPTGPILFREEVRRGPVSPPPPPLVGGPPRCPHCGRAHVHAIVIVRLEEVESPDPWCALCGCHHGGSVTCRLWSTEEAANAG
jgi:hypothetical protein